MAIQTVLGPVEREQLGLTLPHDHLFIDLTCQFAKPTEANAREQAYEPVGPEHYELLARNPYALRDNLLLDDVDLTVAEISRFQAAGGRTVVDCTSVGAGRDVAKLVAVAQRTGLNIIMGCGYYLQETHPPELAELSPEAMAEVMVRELTVGVGDSGVRAGIIGEIGTGDPIGPGEQKSLRAAALAHRATGAPLQVHTYPWGRRGLEIADELVDWGVDPARLVICHIDVDLDLVSLRELLRRGVFIEFDDFGKEFPVEEDDHGFAGGPFASDAQRVQVLAQLVAEGYERQLLMTNDLCFKQMLHRYGGRGYDHVLVDIVPQLAAAGLSPAVLEQLLIHNPARWLEPD
ncbi:MAG TPA: phosphotriesterase-related protein [Armatimonadota bacterium]|jgi:phosphotriesterase-related protein